MEDVKVFDLYEGAQVGDGNKSVAFRITYRDLKKTLTDEVINEVMRGLIKRLEKRFSASYRLT